MFLILFIPLFLLLLPDPLVELLICAGSISVAVIQTRDP